MAKSVICDSCNKLIEYKLEPKYEGGTSYITLKCPLCGHIKCTTINHMHYGNDGIQ